MHKICWAGCLLSLALSLSAQDRATINGTVTDPAGALVTGASVELQAPETGLRRSTLTNDNGIYEFSSLGVGRYTITMTKAGFKPSVIRQVNLLFGQTRTVDASLAVGGT